MKKIFTFILTVLLLLTPAISAFAEGEAESQPRVMITDCRVEGELKAGKTAKLFLTLTNMSNKTNIRNMKISFSESSGDIMPVGRSSGYVEALGKKKSCVWDVEVTVSETAKDGAHSISVACEFETASGSSGSSTDSFTLDVIGQRGTTAVDANNSKPYLMVTDYSVEKDYISPSESRVISVSIKNTNPTESVRNIKLSFADESGEIIPDGMGTEYVKNISAGGSYIWKIPVTASHTAASGEHKITVTMEYEDSRQQQLSSSDTVRLTVRQSVALSYGNAQLPVKVIQGETVTMSINLMNTGKSVIYNCMLEFDIDSLQTGGSVLVGEIKAGETKTGSANLRVSEDKLGEIKGTVTLTYEDEIGDKYEEIIEVKSKIEKKAEITETEKEEEKKNPLWWLFLIGGVALGGGLGFGIPYSIRSSKQRKEDEKRL